MDRPTLFLDSAAHLPPIDPADLWHPNRPPAKFPLRLAAMAKAPAWLRDVTHGRPLGTYAEGDEVPLMEAALQARAAPLFRSQEPIAVYRAALEAGWRLRLDEGAFGIGSFEWATWRSENLRTVVDGTWIVCTCARGVECHTAWLAPFLARAGWRVVLRGEQVRS